MKILNLHGFMGEADNKNYKALCEIFQKEDIISPKIDYINTSPEELFQRFADMVDIDNCIFVGQSLGGWYADKLSRKFKCPCILTNPCNYPHKLELITASGISASYVEQYREKSSYTENERAYTLCSDADTILPDNYADCVKLARCVRRVHGSHSTIENVGEHISALLTEMQNDGMFSGRSQS